MDGLTILSEHLETRAAGGQRRRRRRRSCLEPFKIQYIAAGHMHSPPPLPSLPLLVAPPDFTASSQQHPILDYSFSCLWLHLFIHSFIHVTPKEPSQCARPRAGHQDTEGSTVPPSVHWELGCVRGRDRCVNGSWGRV